MMSQQLKKLIKQNEIIISLLGRMAFTKEEVSKIVTSKKQNPEKYIEGYNALNGNRSLSDIARIVGVTPGTLSPILKEWEELGIIYEVEKPKGKFYKKIFPI
jgi:DNA-binding MarR family transcriptional regulator